MLPVWAKWCHSPRRVLSSKNVCVILFTIGILSAARPFYLRTLLNSLPAAMSPLPVPFFKSSSSSLDVVPRSCLCHTLLPAVPSSHRRSRSKMQFAYTSPCLKSSLAPCCLRVKVCRGTGTRIAASPPCQPVFLSFPISLWGQIQTLPDAPGHSLQVFRFVPPPPEYTHAKFSPSQKAAFCFSLPDLCICCSLCFFPSVPSSLSFTTLLGSVPWCPRQLVTSWSAVAHCTSSSQ